MGFRIPVVSDILDPKLGASDQTKAQISSDLSATRGLSGDFLNAYKSAGAAGAPTMGAASVGPIERANAPTVGATNVGAAPTITAATQAPASTVASTMVKPAAQSQGVNLGPAQLQNATAVRQAATVDPTMAKLGPAQVAGAAYTGPVERATAASINTGRSDEFRGGQIGLVSNLQDAIAGKGPSVAQEQLKQTLDSNIAGTRGNAVAASRGGNTALAMREMLRQQGNLNQQAAGQGALVRANEVATARGQLGGVLDSARGTDVGIESQNAQMQQQAALANAGAANSAAATNAQLGTQANLAGMQALNANKLAEAQLGVQVAQGNQGAQNSVGSQQAALDAAQAANNANTLNTRDTTQASMDLQNRQFNAGAQNTVSGQQAAIDAAAAQQNAAAQNSVAANNAGFTQQANVQNAGNQLSVTELAANLNAQRQAQQAAITSSTNLANAGAANAAATTNAGFEQQAGANNQNAAVTTNGQNITAKDSAGRLALGGQQTVNSGDFSVADMEAKANAAKATYNAGLVDTGLQVAGVGAPTSDRRAKKNIREEGERPLEALFAALKPSSYEYKDPGEHGSGTAPGRRFGVMAQDLERGGPMGKSLVFDDKGTKKIDAPQAIGVVMAMSKHLHDRLRKLEGRR